MKVRAHLQWATAGMLGASVIVGCAGANPPDESPRACQLANTTSGHLTIGSYSTPPASIDVTKTFEPASPTEPPPEPASVRVDVAVSADGVGLHFSGDGPVSWSSRAVAMAFDPTGSPLEISGKCIIQLDIWGVTASNSSGIERTIGTTQDPVAEVVRLPRRDDLTQVFIGLRARSEDVEVHADDGAEPALTITQNL